MKPVIMIVGIIVIVIIFGALIAANTKAINEERAIRKLIDQLGRELKTMTPATPLIEIEALRTRMAEVKRRQDLLSRSPFVIERRP